MTVKNMYLFTKERLFPLFKLFDLILKEKWYKIKKYKIGQK